MIRLSYEKIAPNLFDFSKIEQRPILSVLKQFVNRGDDEDFATFTHNIIGIDKQSYKNSGEYLEHTTKTIEALKKYIKENKKNATIFDPRISSALQDRYFDSKNLDKFSVLSFDVSDYDESTKNTLFETIKNAPLRSFASYALMYDENTIKFYYADKCLALTEDGFHWYTCRDKISLFEGNSSIKDANIISLNLCYELSKTLNSLGKGDEEFIFFYGANNEKSISATAKKIVDNTNKTQEEKQEIAKQEAKQEAIEKQAKAQLKNEKQVIRDSQAPASIENFIKIDENLPSFDKNNKYANSLALFDEKNNQIKNNAIRNAETAYNLIKGGLEKGETFNDCLNAIKQKFGNNELLINLIMDNINADLETLKEKEQEILDKNAQIESLNDDITRLNDKVTQAENEAKKWNSIFQKKNIELEKTKQSYENTIAEMKKTAQETIEKLINDYEDEIEGFQGTIERLDKSNKELQKSFNDEKALNSEINAKNASLEQELKAKDNEIAKLKNELEQAKKNIETKDELLKIYTDSDSSNKKTEQPTKQQEPQESNLFTDYETNTNTQEQNTLFTEDDDSGGGGSTVPPTRQKPK